MNILELLGVGRTRKWTDNENEYVVIPQDCRKCILWSFLLTNVPTCVHTQAENACNGYFV